MGRSIVRKAALAAVVFGALLASYSCAATQVTVSPVLDEPYTIFRQTAHGLQRQLPLRFENQTDSVVAASVKASVGQMTIVCPLEPLPAGVSHDIIWIPDSRSVTLEFKFGDTTSKLSVQLPVVGKDQRVVVPRSKTIRKLTPFCIRGTNYYPRENPWPWMWRAASKETYEADCELMHKLHINTFRTFPMYDADPNYSLYWTDGTARSTAQKKINDLLTAADKNGLKAILCIDNATLDVVGAKRIFKSIMGPFVEDGRILMWDVRNEPGGADGPNSTRELANYMRTMYAYTEKLTPNHLHTVGLAWQFDQLWAIGVHPDVGQYHDYSCAVGLPTKGQPQVRSVFADIAWVKTIIGKTPVFIGEFGTPVSGDYNESRQLKVYQGVFDGAEAQHIIGVCNWTVYEFTKKQVPDEHERTPGIVRIDGSLRPSGELLVKTYKRWQQKYPAPWESGAK